jgi:hypothetical protein
VQIHKHKKLNKQGTTGRAVFYVRGSVHHESIFVSVQRDADVPVVAYAVLSTPDDGCKEHPKHVERSCSAINIDC